MSGQRSRDMYKDEKRRAEGLERNISVLVDQAKDLHIENTRRIAELEVVVENLITGLEEARHNMPTSRLHAIDSITEALSRAANPSKDALDERMAKTLDDVDADALKAIQCKEDPAWLTGDLPSNEKPGDAWERGVNYIRGILKSKAAALRTPGQPAGGD